MDWSGARRALKPPSNTRMDATCAAGGRDMSAMMIEIIQDSGVTRRMAHARHARSR